MAKFKLNGTLATIFSVIAIALSGGAIARQFSNEDTKEVSVFAYTVGALDEEGKIDKKDKSCMVTDKFDADDLVSIEIDEDADLTVSIAWFDEDGGFISTSAVTSGEKPTAPSGAKKFRVEIEATGDEDGEISMFEKTAYAKLVKVTLKK